MPSSPRRDARTRPPTAPRGHVGVLRGSSVVRFAGLLAGVTTGLVTVAGCSPSLSDEARDSGGTSGGGDGAASGEPYDSTVCALVRTGIDAYNAGDLQASVRAFDDALPQAEARVQQIGAGDGAREARDLLAAVRYYARLDVERLREAFPASPETRRFQVTTLSQCQPLPSGLDDPVPEDAQDA